MRTTYDREKIKRQFANNYGDGVFGDLLLLGEQRKIADHLNLKLVEYHGLGELPVLFCPNIPHKN